MKRSKSFAKMQKTEIDSSLCFCSCCCSLKLLQLFLAYSVTGVSRESALVCVCLCQLACLLCVFVYPPLCWWHALLPGKLPVAISIHRYLYNPVNGIASPKNNFRARQTFAPQTFCDW